MSSLYHLHNAVTIPEFVEFKHKEKKKKGRRLMVVTEDSFPIDEADIQTHVPKKAL